LIDLYFDRYMEAIVMSPQNSPSPSVKTTAGEVGHSRAMPDDRVLITLSDGQSFVVDADRLQPQPDGTYVVALTTADRMSVRPAR
jgi:hypothetical protein